MFRVVVCNQKGGVSKTTTVLGLAEAFQELGKQVLVVDADPQANSTRALGVDPQDVAYHAGDLFASDQPRGGAANAAVQAGMHWDGDPPVYVVASPGGKLAGVDVAAAPEAIGMEYRLRRALEGLDEIVDVVLIDTGPNIGKLTIAAMTAADYALVAAQGSAFSVEGVVAIQQAIRAIQAGPNPALQLAAVIVGHTPHPMTLDARDRIGDLEQLVGEERVWRPWIPTRAIVPEAQSGTVPLRFYGGHAELLTRAFQKHARRLLELAQDGLPAPSPSVEQRAPTPSWNLDGGRA